MPIVTTQGEYRYVGRLTVTFDAKGKIVSTDTAKSGPVRVSGRPGRMPDCRPPRTPQLKATITDPLVAYKASLGGNVIGTTEVRARRRQPEPDPPA